jgi:predicted NACHT family NTPase
VQVVEDRSAFEAWKAEEQERMRAAGHDVGRLVYNPRAARPEEEPWRDSQPPPSPPVTWDEVAAARFPRAIILGDPGFGKSWLLRYEARLLARAAYRQLKEQTVHRDELIVPILARLSDVNRTDDALDDELIAFAGQGYSTAFRNWLRQQLGHNRCVVLLDAWDEVPLEMPADGQPVRYATGYRQRLGQRLAAFARQYPALRLLLTSRMVGYGASPIPEAQELELLAFEQAQITAFAHVWFNDARAERFLAMLQQNPAVRGLARIPLMLALMCRAFHAEALTFPTRRVALYEQCLSGLLRDWQAEDKQKGVSQSDVEAVLEMLAAVAERLFVEGREQFSETVLREQMVAFLQTLAPWHELHGQKPADLIAYLKHAGILVQAGEQRSAPLLFLHRTFHEYLAAQALAARAKNSGWEAIAALVDRKAWRP